MGCRALPPGGLPEPGIEPTSLMSPALAGRFLTTSATGETQVINKCLENKLLDRNLHNKKTQNSTFFSEKIEPSISIDEILQKY